MQKCAQLLVGRRRKWDCAEASASYLARGEYYSLLLLTILQANSRKLGKMTQERFNSIFFLNLAHFILKCSRQFRPSIYVSTYRTSLVSPVSDEANMIP